MTDETPVVTPEDGDGDDNQIQEKTFPLSYVEELRKENAARRVKIKEMEASNKEAEDARLAKDKEWEELATQRAGEIEELTPYRQRYDDMVESVAESNTKRIEAIPEQMRSMVPEFDNPLKVATWLDANSQLLAKPTAPILNGNAGNVERPGETETLSAEELAYARKMNITAKEYQDSKRG